MSDADTTADLFRRLRLRYAESWEILAERIRNLVENVRRETP